MTSATRESQVSYVTLYKIKNRLTQFIIKREERDK
jgi:hypothetical protein